MRVRVRARARAPARPRQPWESAARRVFVKGGTPAPARTGNLKLNVMHELSETET